MRTRLLNLLLLAALLYSASLLWRFVGQPPPALPPIETGGAPPPAAAAERGVTSATPEVRPEAYEVIVARDLFSPTRGVVPPAPAAAAQPAARPQPPPKLTLYGVVVLDGEKSAYIQEGAQEGRPTKVRENQPFAGGTIVSIRPDGVTFQYAGSEIVLPLRAPKETPPGGVGESGAAAQQPSAPVAYPRRVPQAAAGRGAPAGGAPTRMQPTITRGQIPPGVAQGQIPAALTPAQSGPVLSPFPQPAPGEGDMGEEELPQENPFEGGGAQEPAPEERNP